MSILQSSIVPASAGGYEIANSLRFNDDDSAYLSRTPASAGNRKTWTWSGWVKLGNLKTYAPFLEIRQDASNFAFLRLENDSIRVVNYTSSAITTDLKTTSKYRDVASWYHIIIIWDTTNSTEADRVRIYVNRERVADFSTSNYPSLNELSHIQNTYSHKIGADQSNAHYTDGYLAEVNFIDGQALTPDNFGETGDYGEWKPIEYTGTYGTNGFYLDFENSGSLGADVSGNSNNWTPTNLAATDQMLDTPTNNFATMNPLDKHSSITLSEGNNYLYTTSSSWISSRASFGSNSGKWYWEVFVNGLVSSTEYSMIGVMDSSGSLSSYAGSSASTYGYSSLNGKKYNNGGSATYGAAFTQGDIIGLALDMDSGSLTFYKNGVSQGVAWSSITKEMFPAISHYCNAGSAESMFNFGQDSSFAGNKTAQGNSDGNGIGDFYYTPPTGYLALCTANLPDPAVIPSEHFNTVTYTGNGSTQSVSVGLQPDFTWIKNRQNSDWHILADSVRGAGNILFTNSTTSELGNGSTDLIESFNTGGFTVNHTLLGGDNDGTNAINENYVAWNWKANGAGVSNTDGSITSTVSANVDAGFSIVSWTGTSSQETIGHSLNQAPNMIIVKNRGETRDWRVYHSANTSEPETDYLTLSTTAATVDSSTRWSDTAPTSSVFSVGGSLDVNANGYPIIAYCFHSVDGYSKVGSYTGNGSTDGTFVYTGFRPAYVMYKRSNSTGGWRIADNPRSGYRNEVDQVLRAESTSAEGNYAGTDVDFLSNGFKLRGTDSIGNTSGGAYIFIAFAENPFKHTNAR